MIEPEVSEATHVAIMDAADAQGIRLTFVARGVVELLQDLSAIVNGVRITVPKGFQCDGASIPRMLQRVYGHPLTKRYLRAALFHDWLVRARPWSQRMVSVAFYRLLREDHNGFIRARSMFYAVRWFGPKWKEFVHAM